MQERPLDQRWTEGGREELFYFTSNYSNHNWWSCNGRSSQPMLPLKFLCVYPTLIMSPKKANFTPNSERSQSDLCPFEILCSFSEELFWHQQRSASPQRQADQPHEDGTCAVLNFISSGHWSVGWSALTGRFVLNQLYRRQWGWPVDALKPVIVRMVLARAKKKKCPKLVTSMTVNERPRGGELKAKVKEASG